MSFVECENNDEAGRTAEKWMNSLDEMLECNYLRW